MSTDDPRAGIGIGQPGDPMFTLQKGKQHAVAFGGNRTSGPRDVASAVNSHGGGSGRMDFETETFVVGTLQANGKAAGSATQQDAEAGHLVPIAHTLRGQGLDASEDGTGRATPIVPTIAFNPQAAGKQTTLGANPETASAVNTSQVSGVSGVRRLMPIETLRLQGFPDDWLDDLGLADGPKYAMCGNAVAVPCAKWIGRRILMAKTRK